MTSSSLEVAREALSYLPSHERDLWYKVGMGLKYEYGDTAFDVFDTWSRNSPNYNKRDTEITWRSFNSTAPNGGRPIGLGTLIHEAKARGYKPNGEFKPHQPMPEEIAERERQLQAERDELARKNQESARTAARVLAIAQQPQEGDPNPYLTHKGVEPTVTLREIGLEPLKAIIGYHPSGKKGELKGRILIAPIKVNDRLSSLEMIDETGNKATLKGSQKSHGYWATGPLPEGDSTGQTLAIGEGVATTLTPTQVMGWVGVVSFSNTNIGHVANAMRTRYPSVRRIILADLDKKTGEPDRHAVEAVRCTGAILAVPDFGPDRDPNHKDWNDLLVLRGPDEVRRQFEAVLRAAALPESGGTTVKQVTPNEPPPTIEQWPEPMPLAAKVDPEPYPLDALPDIIREAVDEVLKFVKAPLPMVASSALAALSLAIQAHADAKRAEKLSGPTSLFMLTIADSGERKSTLDGFFMKAVRDYEEAQVEAAKPILKDYRAAIEAWDSKRSGVKDKIRQLAKEKKPTDEMETTLRDLEYNKPEPPRIPRLLYADATPEALSYGLAKQWPSGGVVSAEAGIVFGSHGMGKDSIMRNLGLLNQLWDGTSLTIDRRTSESFTVRGVRLTVALQVQEPTLREFFTRSGSLARGTGFLARFLVAWPDSTQGYRSFSEAPENWPYLAAFHRRIAAILNQPTPIDDDGVLTPSMLSLTADAKKAWVEYHDAIEGELKNGGELYDVRDVASKSADNAVRLAALFQHFEGAGGAIGVAAFENASRITAWHLNESRRFFGELALPAELADAARLDSWLIEYCGRNGVKQVPVSAIQKSGPSGLRNKAAMELALRELEVLERARLVRGIGKARVVEVNPALLEVAASVIAVPEVIDGQQEIKTAITSGTAAAKAADGGVP